MLRMWGCEVSDTMKHALAGDSLNTNELVPLVYAELRDRAARFLAAERPDHTLQPTALVHEAYARLAARGATFASRLHFFNAAALAMRRILIDHAKLRRGAKRGGGRARVDFDDVDVADGAPDALDWLALDEALRALADVSPRRAQVVSLRFLAGCAEIEIAQMLGISEPTVRRDWTSARLWLYRFMQSHGI
jgi:RNA polymerase sigma factor (TIGR02999 family)